MTRRRWTALLVLVLAAGATWASVSLAASGSKKTTRAKARAAAVACSPANPQPAQPLEMNTVAVEPVAKTVAMDKEIFSCDDNASPGPFTRDVEIYLELVERATTNTAGAPNVITVARRVQVSTCDKFFVTGKVECRTSTPRLADPVSNAVRNCRPVPPTGVVRPPEDPVEMNSVAIGSFIKTINLEKEVVDCGNTIGEIYLFTEVIERRATAPDGGATYQPFATRYEGIMCRKLPQTGAVLGCTRFTTAP